MHSFVHISRQEALLKNFRLHQMFNVLRCPKASHESYLKLELLNHQQVKALHLQRTRNPSAFHPAVRPCHQSRLICRPRYYTVPSSANGCTINAPRPPPFRMHFLLAVSRLHFLFAVAVVPRGRLMSRRCLRKAIRLYRVTQSLCL